MTRSADVSPNLKPKGPCECDLDACTLFGTLGREDRTGKRHVRGCPCNRCRGKRNRAKGDSKARAARKALAIGGVNSRHEELFGGALRVEIKAGGQIAPAYSAFVRCEQQSEQARPVGDVRPFAAVFMPDGTTDGVLAIRMSRALDFAVALLENIEAAS